MKDRYYSAYDRHGEKAGHMPGTHSQANAHSNRIVVSRATDAVIVSVFGLGNMFLAPTLRSFVETELKQGFTNFVIDLTHCEGMDSTFMGTFIGLSNQVRSYGWFCLVNVSEDNRRLLKMLGVSHFVDVRDERFPIPEGKTTALYPTADPYVRTQQIRDAHKLLIQVNPENAALFAPFIEELENETRKNEVSDNQIHENDFPTIIKPPEDDADEDDSNG